MEIVTYFPETTDPVSPPANRAALYLKSGQLYFYPSGGTPAPLLTSAVSLSSAWPIDSIFISVSATNPASSLGFGTWTAFGTGRVMVAVDTGDANFNTVEKTGGASTHTLTSAEMPVHTHVQDAHTHTDTGHAHTQQGSNGGASGTAVPILSGGTHFNSTDNSQANIQNTTATNQNAGSGGAHNNLQPYITVYMWKRTA